MKKIINKPSKFKAYLTRWFFMSSGKQNYNEFFNFFFTLEDFKKLMMIEEFLKPYLGKYKTIKYFLLPNTKYDLQLPGCGIHLYDELEYENLFSVLTTDKKFTFGNATYTFKEDGLYLTNGNADEMDIIKRRNKLEKEYT